MPAETTAEHNFVPFSDHTSLNGFSLRSHLVNDHRVMPSRVWYKRESERHALHRELHAR